MPATETTWRDLKLMHVVFGVSSLVMLVTTIWMMADDHNRPWKAYQRQFQEIEAWAPGCASTSSKARTSVKKRVELEQQLSEARNEPLDLSLVSQFVVEAKSVDEDQSEVDAVESNLAEYKSAEADGSRERRLAMRDALLESMCDLIARRRFREDNLTVEVKGVKAELDRARAYYDMAVGKGRSDEIDATRQNSIRFKIGSGTASST